MKNLLKEYSYKSPSLLLALFLVLYYLNQKPDEESILPYVGGIGSRAFVLVGAFIMVLTIVLYFTEKGK